MFQNYFIVALRNVIRHKLHSFINIAGLAVGLCCVTFVMLFVQDELSYDKWLPQSDNLHRIEMTIVIPGRPPLDMAVIPFPLPAAMKDQIPEVTGMTRLWSQNATMTVGDRQFSETVRVVDPEFFRIIQLPMISGDPGNVLRQPNSIVLSQAAAEKYFGNADPIGKIITTGRGDCEQNDTACASVAVSLKVTGVIRDIPHNSQLEGDVFIPNTSAADSYSKAMKQNWFSQSGYGYVTLAPGTDLQSVIAKMAPILDRSLTGELRKSGITTIGSKVAKIHLTPFIQVHLTSDRWSFNLTPPGSWLTVYGVTVIGLLILLVACFNFMNLATAQALMRAREIALRKTLGARRGQLITQFLAEAVLMSCISLLFALAAVEVLLPTFSNFVQRPITFDYLADWPLLLAIIGVAVAAGLISGSYPAVVLSRFRPAAVLRTNNSAKSGSGRLRSTLVVLQFAVSIGLGIAALVVFSQISFARNISLGFRHDNILIIRGGHLLAEGRESIVQTLRSYPGILDIGGSDIAPFDNGQNVADVRIPGQSETISLNKIGITPGFVQVYDLRLMSGRLLSANRTEDQFGSSGADESQREGRNILVNESAAKRLGLSSQNAIGKTILFDNNHVRIIGVLEDAKFGGAREPIKPTAYFYDPKLPVELALRLKGDSIPQTLEFVDKAWRAYSPASASRHYFLDDSFDRLYRADEREGTMFGFFVGIAILIACLGLFGLAAFTAGRRTKEIGIRRVFGARTRDVIFLLLWQFSIPVLIANAIAWPLAWYYLQGWLQGFAFRIDLNPLYFAVISAAALVIAWATVIFHAMRVASANPIQALRHE